MSLFKCKDLSVEVKDVDDKKRTVKIALSKFDNIDSHKDIIVKGAFKKSINERGPNSSSNRKIKFLRYHDFEHPIGVFKELTETNDYLVGVAELGMSTKGNDAFLDYKQGIITEHSVGFQEIADKIETKSDGVRVLKELILWEGSAVTFGANSETPFFGMKQENTKEFIHSLNQKMNNLTQALKNGKGSDERLEQLAMNIRVCQTKYNELINSLIKKEPTKVTPESKSQNINDFYLELLKY